MNDEIKKALATIQDLKGDPEYLINKARENQANKIISAWNKSKKEGLKYKLSRHGILIPRKAIENYWNKEKIQVDETKVNGNNSYTATAWIGDKEYIEFDIHKRKATAPSLVFRNHKLGVVK